MSRPFELQGHRGARGLLPENTLPSFEAALDAGVGSIETDLHLTRDHVPVLCHDPLVSAKLFRPIPGTNALELAPHQPVAGLELAQLRCYRGDRNPDPARFPEQRPIVTPLAGLFAARHGIDPYTVPTLAEMFAFVEDYRGAPGEQAGKTPLQRQSAGRVWFDLELKRVPFWPEAIGDDYRGEGPARLETCTLEVIRAAGMLERTRVRGFDHRCIAFMRRLEPKLEAAILIAGTAPVAPAVLVRAADAAIYCPEYSFLDAASVRQLHAEGLRVLPWTVNKPDAWRRLLDWGVDGITTDYPDRLAAFLPPTLFAER